MAKVIYPILQRPKYRQEGHRDSASGPELMKIGKGYLTWKKSGSHYATNDEMSERSTERRNVAVTLPKLRYME